jgi:DHA3 family macrolide efflux protein-like MFS transporter
MHTQTHSPIFLRQNRAFLSAFAAHICSSLGDWFDFIALLTLFTYVWNADPLTMAMLPVAYALPGLLLSQAAGVTIDESNPQKVLLYMSILQGGFTLLLLLPSSPVWMLILVLIRSAIGVFHMPAQQAMVRRIVPESQLVQAAGLMGTAFQLTKIIGPMLGAFTVTLFPYTFCLLLNAGSFFVSVLLLLFFRLDYIKSEPYSSKSSFISQWREGWKIIFSHPTVSISFVFSFGLTAIIQIIDVQLPVLLREIHPEETGLAGWLLSTIGGGAVCSSAFLSRRKDISYSPLLRLSACLMGSSVFSLGYYSGETPLFWLFVSGVVCGIGTGLSFTTIHILFQKEVPQYAIGRVQGIYQSILHSLFIVAPLLGGWLVTEYGTSTVFLGCGICAVVIGALYQKSYKCKKK